MSVSPCIQYDNGYSTQLVYKLTVGKGGEYYMNGHFEDAPTKHRGSYSMQCKIDNKEELKGWCPAQDTNSPEGWLTSWPELTGEGDFSKWAIDLTNSQYYEHYIFFIVFEN